MVSDVSPITYSSATDTYSASIISARADLMAPMIGFKNTEDYPINQSVHFITMDEMIPGITYAKNGDKISTTENAQRLSLKPIEITPGISTSLLFSCSNDAIQCYLWDVAEDGETVIATHSYARARGKTQVYQASSNVKYVYITLKFNPEASISISDILGHLSITKWTGYDNFYGFNGTTDQTGVVIQQTRLSHGIDIDGYKVFQYPYTQPTDLPITMSLNCDYNVEPDDTITRFKIDVVADINTPKMNITSADQAMTITPSTFNVAKAVTGEAPYNTSGSYNYIPLSLAYSGIWDQNYYRIEAFDSSSVSIYDTPAYMGASNLPTIIAIPITSSDVGTNQYIDITIFSGETAQSQSTPVNTIRIDTSALTLEAAPI